MRDGDDKGTEISCLGREGMQTERRQKVHYINDEEKLNTLRKTKSVKSSVL